MHFRYFGHFLTESKVDYICPELFPRALVEQFILMVISPGNTTLGTFKSIVRNLRNKWKNFLALYPIQMNVWPFVMIRIIKRANLWVWILCAIHHSKLQSLFAFHPLPPSQIRLAYLLETLWWFKRTKNERDRQFSGFALHKWQPLQTNYTLHTCHALWFDSISC